MKALLLILNKFCATPLNILAAKLKQAKPSSSQAQAKLKPTQAAVTLNAVTGRGEGQGKGLIGHLDPHSRKGNQLLP